MWPPEHDAPFQDDGIVVAKKCLVVVCVAGYAVLRLDDVFHGTPHWEWRAFQRPCPCADSDVKAAVCDDILYLSSGLDLNVFTYPLDVHNDSGTGTSWGHIMSSTATINLGLLMVEVLLVFQDNLYALYSTGDELPYYVVATLDKATKSWVCSYVSHLRRDPNTPIHFAADESSLFLICCDVASRAKNPVAFFSSGFVPLSDDDDDDVRSRSSHELTSSCVWHPVCPPLAPPPGFATFFGSIVRCPHA